MCDVWEICNKCGLLYGNKTPNNNISTNHQGICDICGFAQIVSHPREYGFLKNNWNDLYYENCKKGRHYGSFL